MPVQRTRISESQLADLLGVDPACFIAVERRCDKEYSGWCVVTEGEMQTTGTFPEIHDNKTRKTPRKGMRGK